MKKSTLRKTGSLLLAVSLVWGSFSGFVYAQQSERSEVGIKPENGSTTEQPFRPGTGGSQNFRIPCMVTLNDGTIVTACDARWNHASDACGLDTIVSYSKDNGDSWNYTFANYIGDNGNKFHIQSTAFIDPAITSDGENVYMIADLYPAGIAINTTPDSHRPKTGHTGFNDKNQLVLAKATDDVNGTSSSDKRIKEKFDYYLEKNSDKDKNSYYLLKDKNNQVVEGYTIDAYFNIKGKNIDTNIFAGDSPYFPWPADYLYMTKSSDGGANWSEPMLLNLKKSNEQTLLVGPGRGITTSSGRILFTAYEFTNGDKNSVCIYSDDGGITWKRGESVKGWSSEAVVTEADGRIYMFTRHGRSYYISNDMGSTWSDEKKTGVTYNDNCQLSAITYSQKINGKTAILLSAPSSTNSRSAGKIFTAFVEGDGSLSWPYEYSINGNDYYAYSCLAELKNGSVGLLYESDGSKISFKKMDIRKIVKNAAVGNIWCSDDTGTGVSDVVLNSNETVAYTVNGVKDLSSVEVRSSNTEVVSVDYKDGKVKLNTKQVNGLARAVVSVLSPEGFTDIHVTVTDSQNYSIVDLRIGDEKTIKDDTGNYSSNELTGLDSSIVDVVMKGQDPDDSNANKKPELEVEIIDETKNAISSCEFSLKKLNDKQFNISSIAEENKSVFLNLQKSGNTPTTTSESKIEFIKDEKGDTFKLKDVDANRYLHFWNDKLHYDRCQNPCTNGNDSFEIFIKNTDYSNQSSIAGYSKITDLSQMDNSSKILIARNVNGVYYIMHPSTKNDTKAYVAKVTDKIFETPIDKGWTEITFKGVSEGETSVSIGDKNYFIFVKNDVKDVSMKIGDTYKIIGEFFNQPILDQMFSVEKKENDPPYSELHTFEEGLYLLGQGSVIVKCEASTAEGSEKGLAMRTSDLTTNDCTDELWRIQKYENGYSIQGTNGQYVNISGSNVELTSNPQELQIEKRQNGGYSVSDGKGRYLNNWGGANNKVAAYTADNNAWSFYKPSVNYIFTAKSVGTTTVVGKQGKNYSITVSCEHSFTDWNITKEPTFTEPGEQQRSCKICGYTETEILPVMLNPEKPENPQNQENAQNFDDSKQESSNQLNQNTINTVQTGDTTPIVLFVIPIILSGGYIFLRLRKKL